MRSSEDSRLIRVAAVVGAALKVGGVLSIVFAIPSFYYVIAVQDFGRAPVWWQAFVLLSLAMQTMADGFGAIATGLILDCLRTIDRDLHRRASSGTNTASLV